MINRVTNLTMTTAAQRGLQEHQARLAEAQNRATSLDKMSRPSDDPAAMASALQTRSLQAAAAQYGRNIDDATAWVTLGDSAMEQATNALNKVRDLTFQGGNGSLSPAARDALAGEIESLNAELFQVANSTFSGRNLFAGSSDAAGAFSPGKPPTFNGVAGSSVERRIGAEGTVRVDLDGAAIFGEGANSTFALLSGITAALRSGADVSGQVAAVDTKISGAIAARADLGTRQARLEKVAGTNKELESHLENQRTGLEKEDLGAMILNLKLQENNYQAALAATAKVLQPSLMDFLR